MPSGTWRHQRNLSTPREEQRKEDTPGSSSTPGCSPGSSLPRLVYENQERCQAVSESTLFCPPLTLLHNQPPRRPVLLPDLEQVASHSLTSGPHAFVLPHTSLPFSLVWLRGKGCQFC